MPEPAPEVRREILPAKQKPRAPDPGAHPSKKNLYVSRRSAKKSAQMLLNVKRRDHCRDYKQLKNAAFRKIEFVCKTRFWKASRSGGARIGASDAEGPRGFLKHLQTVAAEYSNLE